MQPSGRHPFCGNCCVGHVCGRLAAVLAGDLVQRTAQINRELEALIRLCPQQYLWGYNRYKEPRGARAPPEGKLAAKPETTS